MNPLLAYASTLTTHVLQLSHFAVKTDKRYASKLDIRITGE